MCYALKLLLLLGLVAMTLAKAIPNQNPNPENPAVLLQQFVQFWDNIAAFAQHFLTDAQQKLGAGSELSTLFSPHLELLQELASAQGNVGTKTDLLRLLEAAEAELQALQAKLTKLMQSTGLAAQLQLDGQVRVFCEVELSTLQKLLRQIALLKEILYVTTSYADSDGHVEACCGTLEFKDAASRAAFNQQKLEQLHQGNLDKFGITKMQLCGRYAKQTPQQAEFSNVGSWKNQYSEITSVAPEQSPAKQTLAQPPGQQLPINFDVNAGPSNLSFSCQPIYESVTYEIPQPVETEEMRIFCEVDQFFNQPGSADQLLRSPHPPSSELAQLLGDLGYKLKRGSLIQISNFASGAAPQLPPQLMPEGGTPAGQNPNTPPGKPTPNNSDENSQPTPPLFDKKEENKAKAAAERSLAQSGMFNRFSPGARQHLCALGGGLYVEGMHVMAQELEGFIAEKDTFFAGLQDSHNVMQKIFLEQALSLPEPLRDQVIQEHQRLGNVLPGNMQQKGADLARECETRMQNAELQFQKNLPLPKDFLVKLSNKQRDVLLCHAKNSIGRACEINSLLINMHFLTNAATKVGFVTGYKHGARETIEPVAKLEAELMAEKQQLTEEKEQLDKQKAQLDEQKKATEAEAKKQKAVAGFAAKKAKDTQDKLDQALQDKEALAAAKQQVESEAKKLAAEKQKAETAQQKAETAQQKAELENQKLKALFQAAMHKAQNPPPAQENVADAPPAAQNLPELNRSVATDDQVALQQENAALRKRIAEVELVQASKVPETTVVVMQSDGTAGRGVLSQRERQEFLKEGIILGERKALAKQAAQLEEESQTITTLQDEHEKVVASKNLVDKKLSLANKKNAVLEAKNLKLEKKLAATTNLLDKSIAKKVEKCDGK